MEHAIFNSSAHVLRKKAEIVARDFFSSSEAADDVVQEVMIRLWKAWPTLSSLADAERLAVRVAKHECINVWRKEQRRPHTSLSPTHEQMHSTLSDNHSLEMVELTEAIRSATDGLQRSEGRLWRMFAEAGMQPGEIASATGIHVRTVSSMLSHARHIIYKILKEGGYIDE